nr:MULTISPECIES: hypothetical protein [unclassified Thioalkalivibrio]
MMDLIPIANRAFLLNGELNIGAISYSLNARFFQRLPKIPKCQFIAMKSN